MHHGTEGFDLDNILIRANVPEPSSALTICAVLGFLAARRRRR